MLDGGVALAVGAGMIAALNPCGFALLPAYLTLLIVGDDQPAPATAVLRAVRMTLAMTAGFATVFAVFGLVVAPAASSVQQYLPWVSLVVGLLLVAAGVWLLTGRELRGIDLRRGRSRPLNASLGSMFGYGVTYALASLTCTIAPFLAVVVAAFRADSPLTGSLLFLAYAGGMGLVVGTAAAAVALARGAIVGAARRVGGAVPVLGGLLLLGVGGYVAYYGWWEIRVLRGGAVEDPVIDVALRLQQWLAGLVGSAGWAGFALAVVAVAATLGALVLVPRLRRRGAIARR